LNFALGFLGLSFRFSLLVAQQLARRFLDAAGKLLQRSFDAIGVRGRLSSCCDGCG